MAAVQPALGLESGLGSSPSPLLPRVPECGCALRPSLLLGTVSSAHHLLSHTCARHVSTSRTISHGPRSRLLGRRVVCVSFARPPSTWWCCYLVFTSVIHTKRSRWTRRVWSVLEQDRQAMRFESVLPGRGGDFPRDPQLWTRRPPSSGAFFPR